MKKEIIIISDLWGSTDLDWLEVFKDRLSADYILKFYDATQLGNVNIIKDEQNHIHKQFIDFGINNAVQKLLESEYIERTYIGCSIGGVIAWKAALGGLPIDKLITISSTRLRLESKFPKCKVYNYFGIGDNYKPNDSWINMVNNGSTFLIEGDHNIYKKAKSVDHILRQTKLLSSS